MPMTSKIIMVQETTKNIPMTLTLKNQIKSLINTTSMAMTMKTKMISMITAIKVIKTKKSKN